MAKMMVRSECDKDEAMPSDCVVLPAGERQTSESRFDGRHKHAGITSPFERLDVCSDLVFWSRKASVRISLWPQGRPLLNDGMDWPINAEIENVQVRALFPAQEQCRPSGDSGRQCLASQL